MKKTELARIYTAIRELEAEKKELVVSVREDKAAIIEAALEQDFRTIYELVADIESKKAEIQKLSGAINNRLAKLKESGYSFTDARFYATGSQPEYFGGGLVPIKPAK